jgi:hypothetical protein
MRYQIHASAFGLLLLAASTRQAQAQLGCAGATCTVEVSMPVVEVLRLRLGGSSVSLGAPAVLDYEAGFRDVTGVAVNVIVKANRPVAVQVGGAAATFTYAGSFANPMKPASHLLWATSAAGLTTTTNHMGATANVLSQGAGSFVVPLYLRTLWTFAVDVPGSYSLAISFTLSAP